MSRQEKGRWSYLQIVARQRTITSDGVWWCVRRYGDVTEEDYAKEELAKFRSGEIETVLFMDYKPTELEFRLQRVTSTAYQDTEVIA